MSVAHIGKLQENTAALYRKISQNVGRTYRETSGEYRGTVQNGCETLRISAIRGSGYVWHGKLKCPPLPSGVKRRMWNIRMECRQRIFSDVRYPDGMSTEQNSGCETSGEGGMSQGLSGATPSGFPKRTRGGASLSGLPQGETHGTDSIRILLAFRICLWQRTSKLQFFMFLSFPLLFHGFQITLLNFGLLWWSKSYQNTKT